MEGEPTVNGLLGKLATQPSPLPAAITHMLVEELGHLKHRDLVASQDLFQRGIRMNLASVLRVLEFMGLDIGPHAFGQLRPRQRFHADNSAQLRAGGHRLRDAAADRLGRVSTPCARTGGYRRLGSTGFRGSCLFRLRHT